MYTAAHADTPTPPDSDGDMNLCPDIQPECDQDPSPVPEIEEQLEEHQPLPGRQKASAQLEPIHPPTVILNCALVHLRNPLVGFWRIIMQCPLGHNLKQWNLLTCG